MQPNVVITTIPGSEAFMFSSIGVFFCALSILAIVVIIVAIADN